MATMEIRIDKSEYGGSYAMQSGMANVVEPGSKDLDEMLLTCRSVYPLWLYCT